MRLPAASAIPCQAFAFMAAYPKSQVFYTQLTSGPSQPSFWRAVRLCLGRICGQQPPEHGTRFGDGKTSCGVDAPAAVNLDPSL
ncbi:unnamed protein product [Urochloa humidicola]